MPIKSEIETRLKKRECNTSKRSNILKNENPLHEDPCDHPPTTSAKAQKLRHAEILTRGILG